MARPKKAANEGRTERVDVRLTAWEKAKGIRGRAAAVLAQYQEAPKQFESIRSEAIEAVAPYEPAKRFARATAAHDFDFGRLKTEPTTVYIITPSKKIGVAAKWVSLVVNHIIEAVAEQPGPVTTTFLLDEFPQMPAAPAIPKALELYAGKGVQLWMFSQGRYSLERKWTLEVVKMFEDQAAILQLWGVEDPALLKDVSLWSGTASVAVRGPSHSGGTVEQANTGITEQKRPVLQAEDIRAVGDGRQIVRVAGYPHLFVIDRVPWFQIEPWKDQLTDPRAIFKQPAEAALKMLPSP